YYRFELHGSEGAFSSTYGGMNDKPATWWYTDKEWTHQAPERVEPDWLNAADNMAAAIRTGAALTCDGRDGRRSQAILDGMYRSAYSGGGWVDVTPELT
ncbi:MAG: hypothetical protein GX657_10490, partial [Chloroflexi bacterium]|nr:hypothetical protein [Chloroflexota bacterium]